MNLPCSELCLTMSYIQIRRALGDFGVPIAIVIMVLVDYSAGDGFTEKLKVPNGVEVIMEKVFLVVLNSKHNIYQLKFSF